MANKIDSRTISIGELLSSTSSCFKVPSYQRDYSWEKEQVEQLWNDIIDNIADNKSNKTEEYFMGAIVINNSSQPEEQLIVIDGQQRLATISLLMCAIRDIANKYGKNGFSRGISNSYLGSSTFLTLENEIIKPKLTLNEADNNFFQENFIEYKEISFLKGLSIPKSKKSNKLLLSAYIFMYTEIEQEYKNSADILIDIKNCIDKRCTVISISTPDESNAFLIFEVLNDRGKDLTVADLLKNYIFSKSASPDNSNNLEYIKKKWENISKFVNKSDLKKFIRHYWLSKYEKVIREKELYEALKNELNSYSDVKIFVRDLEFCAETYKVFQEPDINSDLYSLKLFKVNLCHSVLLAAKTCLNEETFSQIIRMMLVISFRYNVICNFSPTKLEEIYNKISLYIRNNKKLTAKQIFNKLIQDYPTVYPKDQVFIKSFSEKSTTNIQLARYILIEISNSYIENKELITNPNSNQLNLEHILPCKPSDEWYLTFKKEEVDSYISRLGNMTLLGSVPNKKIGNASFQNKCKQAYSESELKITQELLSYSEWSPKQIENRQKSMAEIACNIWRLDY
jgi:uncharacterized protein with ParB-like and HNH nuclease domain